MKKLSLIGILMLTACATPVTTMQKGNSIVNCGGGTAGSTFGGLIGYTIQESHDKDCVDQNIANGYKIVTPAP